MLLLSSYYEIPGITLRLPVFPVKHNFLPLPQPNTTINRYLIGFLQEGIRGRFPSQHFRGKGHVNRPHFVFAIIAEELADSPQKPSVKRQQNTVESLRLRWAFSGVNVHQVHVLRNFLIPTKFPVLSLSLSVCKGVLHINAQSGPVILVI